MGGLSGELWSRATGHANTEWNVKRGGSSTSSGSCVSDSHGCPLAAMTLVIFISVGSAAAPASTTTANGLSPAAPMSAQQSRVNVDAAAPHMRSDITCCGTAKTFAAVRKSAERESPGTPLVAAT
jgi:hypothetical protein